MHQRENSSFRSETQSLEVVTPSLTKEKAGQSENQWLFLDQRTEGAGKLQQPKSGDVYPETKVNTVNQDRSLVVVNWLQW